MILKRVLVSFYIGGILYLTTTLFFGSTGIIAYKDLLIQHQLLVENLRRIEEQGERLQQRIRALQSDPEQVRLEARTYHLVQSNESFVRITGREVASEPISPGGIVRVSKTIPFKPEPFLRAFSICIAIVAFLLLGIRSSRKR
ncbi:MAG: septum formation initiator family protein [Spirochaetes bacterium]|nr:septum formation initiator family protein [Spirochaetota bacterium]